MDSSHSAGDVAETLFAQWLAAHEEGRAEPFEALLARHAQHEHALRQHHAD